MDDLVEWLRQQLDEDERAATAAADGYPNWYVGGEGTVNAADTGGSGYLATGPYAGGLSDGEAEHIARWDPARVLREVEAKRLRLDELLALPHYAWDGREEYGCPKVTDAETWHKLYDGGDQVCGCGRDEHVTRSLGIEALPYSDRPGYREEWRP